MENASECDVEQRRFLLLLGRAVLEAPQDLPLDPLPEFETESASLSWDKYGIWHVRGGEETAQGTAPWEGGAWLEQVVAAALVQAGADEVFLHLKWAWPPDVKVPQEGPGDELDVAARFGPAVFAFSCKLRRQGSLAA